MRAPPKETGATDDRARLNTDEPAMLEEQLRKINDGKTLLA